MQTGVGFNLVAAVFNQGSTFLVNVVVANLLGRERFGEYTMVLATVATLGTLGQLSMGYTATKHIAEFRSIDPERTSRILGLCARRFRSRHLAALVLASAAADRRADAQSPRPHLRAAPAAAAVFFTVLNGFLAGALAGLESYRRWRAQGSSAALYTSCAACCLRGAADWRARLPVLPWPRPHSA